MEKEMQNLANDNTRLRVNKRLVSLLDINERIAKDRLEGLAHEKEKLAAGDSSGHNELSEKASEFIREFSADVERLREAYQEEIERQIQRRNDIMEEVAEQERQKQNCLQEFAQLSIKNAQLTDMNNEIVVQIRALYKANSGNAQAAVAAAAAQDVMSPPPLPVSHHSTKASTDASMGSSAALNSVIHHDDASSMAPSSVSTAEQSTPAVTVLQGPQVVNIRKGQPRKFMWKRGGQNVAKVTKGIRGAFTSREGQPGAGGATAAPGNASNGHQFVETPAYNNLPPGGAVETVGGDHKQGGFGFFANQRNKPRTATAPAVTLAAGNGAANDGP
ncbi:Rho-type gtpase-activating protein, partial [Ascosphaera atra]